MITMLMMTNVSQIPAAERTAWIPAKRAFGEGRIDDDDDDDDDDNDDDDEASRLSSSSSSSRMSPPPSSEPAQVNHFRDYILKLPLPAPLHAFLLYYRDI